MPQRNNDSYPRQRRFQKDRRELTGDNDFFYGGESAQREDWEYRAFDNNPWDRREGMYNAGGRDFDERARDSYGYGGRSFDEERFSPNYRPNWSDRPRRSERRAERQSEHPHGFIETVKDFFGVGPKGYKRSDERVREDVSEALARHPEVDASDIEVKVKDGHVTLMGSVESRSMRRLAEEAVENVSGVVDVHLELSLSSSQAGHPLSSPSSAVRSEKPRSGRMQGGRSKMQ